MLAKVYSCAVVGMEGAIVQVEVDTANGLPSMVYAGSDSQHRSPLDGTAGEASGTRARVRFRIRRGSASLL
jgi:magnesium chelatase family protein